MDQDNQPVTKAEFDEGMQMVTNAFENVVTNESLKETLRDYPTKDDLEKALEKHKKELLAEMKQYATKDELKNMFESAVERIEDAVLVTQRNQEQRITALERRR